MNISYNWLKDLIDIDESADELAERLTRVGFAVEGIHRLDIDSIFDIDLTSNRPDCLSHLGIAREVGVITDKKIKLEQRRLDRDRAADAPFPAVLAGEMVKIEEPDLCSRFTARVIRNVKIGPSPEWLVNRLESLGERSINNVADITNYVMLDLGQPMHAFDLDKLSENRIVVRRANDGETIRTLDEVDRKLDNSMLAICDAEKPVAVAGIMGGLDSSITDDTVNVLLEVAHFNRESVRNTSRKLNLATEASYRFERGVDIENLQRASDRAVQLISILADGTADRYLDVYPNKADASVVVAADISYSVKRLTGLDVTDTECERILGALGIVRESIDTYSVPKWRHDLSIEEDLVEEIARHTGYENIAEELPPAFSAGEYQPSEVRKRHLRQSLLNLGFNEAITYSFIDGKYDDAIEPVPALIADTAIDKFVTLRDSVIDGAVRMRPTILVGLLNSLKLNLNHQRRDLKLFEIGKVFATNRGEDGFPAEREVLSLLVTGGELNADRATPVRELDFYDVKGSVETAADAAGLRRLEFSPAEVKHLRSGQAAAVSIGETQIGYIGRLNEEISSDYKFKQPVYVAEIDLQAALAESDSEVVYTPLSKYPPITRDVSFVVNRDHNFQAIVVAIREMNIELCRDVRFVDLYEGKGLAENERSVTVRLEYRSEERTLVEDEVTFAHQMLLDGLETTLGIRPRL